MEVMAEDCGDLAATFNIPAMPAVLLFADGEVRNIGFSPELFEHCSQDLECFQFHLLDKLANQPTGESPADWQN